MDDDGEPDGVGGGAEVGGTDGDEDVLTCDPLNENETVVGISEESCSQPLRQFEAWKRRRLRKRN